MRAKTNNKKIVVTVPNSFYDKLEMVAAASLMQPSDFTRYILHRAVILGHRRVDQGAAAPHKLTKAGVEALTRRAEKVA